MAIGYICFILHAHLPFVRHSEKEGVLEEEWLYEAITEVYIPLLRVFRGLQRDGIDFRLTLSFSPTLLSLLQDDLLQKRYEKYLNRLQQLIAREVSRYPRNSQLRQLAEYYQEEFCQIGDIWRQCGGDLVSAFKQFQEGGYLEIITSAATHAYLPLMKMYPEAVWAQIETACQYYQRVFGCRPYGIWLPECGYYQGLEELLAKAGLRYFIIDSHGINNAKPRPRFSTYAPIFTHCGVAAFGRDDFSSQQVWSSEVGYPSNPVYREFYKDLGWEADYDYIRPYLLPNGQRKNVGIKYYRITSRYCDLGHKQLYEPYCARERAATDASHFLNSRLKQIKQVADIIQRQPIIVCPYDAELYGHWWYEGPWFLDFLFRKAVDCYQDSLSFVHLSQYLKTHPTQQLAIPAESSWGEGGYHQYWLNDTNDWIYPHLHRAIRQMIKLATLETDNPLQLRALNQAARELLLAQSSDWAFILKSGTMVSYATARLKTHLFRFDRLYHAILDNNIPHRWLEQVEWQDNIFPHLDYRVYRPL